MRGTGDLRFAVEAAAALALHLRANVSGGMRAGDAELASTATGHVCGVYFGVGPKVAPLPGHRPAGVRRIPLPLDCPYRIAILKPARPTSFPALLAIGILIGA